MIDTRNQRAFLFFIAAVTALAWMTLDIYVPSLPDLVEYFATNESAAQFTLSMNCLGFFLISPLYGLVVDAYGTRTSLFIALFSLLVCSLSCALATSIEALIIARFFQGCAAAAVLIAEMALMTQLYKGNAFIRASALLGMIITFTLALSPVLGGYIGSYLGWRMTFLFMGLYSGAMLLSMSSLMPVIPHIRKPLSFAKGLYDYSLMLRHGPYLAYVTITALLLGICLTYAGLTSHLFIKVLGVPEKIFGYYQGVGAVAYAIGCILVNRTAHKKDTQELLKLGLILIFLACTAFFGASILAPTSPLWLTIGYIAINITMAFAYVPAHVLSLEVFPEFSSAASALATSLRMLVTSGMVYIAGIFYASHIWPLAIMIFVVGILNLALYIPLLPALSKHKTEAA